MSWNNLSMKERAAYIKAGVNNGIYDLNTIRNSYNSFTGGGFLDNGGHLSSYNSASALSKHLHLSDVARGKSFSETVAKYPYLKY